MPLKLIGPDELPAEWRFERFEIRVALEGRHGLDLTGGVSFDAVLRGTVLSIVREEAEKFEELITGRVMGLCGVERLHNRFVFDAARQIFSEEVLEGFAADGTRLFINGRAVVLAVVDMASDDGIARCRID